MSKMIKNLDTLKATQQGNIPTKTIKDNKGLFQFFIYVSFNNAVCKGVFSGKQNFSDIKPIRKKNPKMKRKSYRPAWILPKSLKLFEHCMYNKINSYFDKILSKHLWVLK